jgi:hypothetical protein
MLNSEQLKLLEGRPNHTFVIKQTVEPPNHYYYDVRTSNIIYNAYLKFKNALLKITDEFPGPFHLKKK